VPMHIHPAEGELCFLYCVLPLPTPPGLDQLHLP
jgi:hypothetical protein